MPTITTNTVSDSGPIECFYDAQASQDFYDLTIPTTDGCLVTLKVHKHTTVDLIDVLKRHDERMRIAAGGMWRGDRNF